jgi:hypothetical protein
VGFESDAFIIDTVVLHTFHTAQKSKFSVKESRRSLGELRNKQVDLIGLLILIGIAFDEEVIETDKLRFPHLDAK